MRHLFTNEIFKMISHYIVLKRLLFLMLILNTYTTYCQEPDRIQNIKNNLELIAVENSELNENLKLEINIANVTLPNFLIAVSKVHQINIDVSPTVDNITIVNNFSDVTVADLLVYLCKEYNLTIDFTGNILSIKKYVPPVKEIIEKEIIVSYNTNDEFISMDLKNNPVEKVFRKIMDVSGKNLLFSRNMNGLPLNLYINNVPFEKAMEKLAEMNNLSYSKSRDGFFLFDVLNVEEGSEYFPNRTSQGNGLNYQVLDTINKILTVDFINTPLSSIINEISYDLKLDVYMAAPLEQASSVTFNAKKIHFDNLLEHIFESQKEQEVNLPQATNRNQNSFQPNNQTATNSNNTTSNNLTFKKENDIYFFGNTNQLSLRNVEVIQMMHRSIELLSDPSSPSARRSAGRTQNSNVNFFGSNNNNNGQRSSQLGGQSIQNLNTNRRNVNTQSRNFDSYQNNVEALVNILPEDIKANLEITVDFELNSFLVSGPSTNINRFKKFIKEIDKPVPVILIEVMIIEVKKSATVETGISWGIGNEPVNTSGALFPTTDLTLGSKTVNKIIGGFDGFGSFNIGQVIPEFFANIKAMETNGNLKIRSTPKLSTLNGHRASLSIGETTYYVVTNQNFFGSQIPTSSEIRNYEPIDAELAISIKPLVSGNGQVTLDINVIQSDFSGERIEADAPPGLTSREFSSIIRMQNQDLAILGGLEEKIKNDSGDGVPFLARIPIIKWLFSKRKREDTKQKLTILIKPTVIY